MLAMPRDRRRVRVLRRKEEADSLQRACSDTDSCCPALIDSMQDRPTSCKRDSRATVAEGRTTGNGLTNNASSTGPAASATIDESSVVDCGPSAPLHAEWPVVPAVFGQRFTPSHALSPATPAVLRSLATGSTAWRWRLLAVPHSSSALASAIADAAAVRRRRRIPPLFDSHCYPAAHSLCLRGQPVLAARRASSP